MGSMGGISSFTRSAPPSTVGGSFVPPLTNPRHPTSGSPVAPRGSHSLDEAWRAFLSLGISGKGGGGAWQERTLMLPYRGDLDNFTQGGGEKSPPHTVLQDLSPRVSGHPLREFLVRQLRRLGHLRHIGPAGPPGRPSGAVGGLAGVGLLTPPRTTGEAERETRVRLSRGLGPDRQRVYL